VRRSVLVDAKADILVYGNAERAIVDIAHRCAARQKPAEMTDIRGTAILRPAVPEDWIEIDSTTIDTPGRSIRRLIPMRWRVPLQPSRRQHPAARRWCVSSVKSKTPTARAA
jgi:radical SAM superfamily enzyme YgiQ (UPF0313 family)